MTIELPKSFLSDDDFVEITSLNYDKINEEQRPVFYIDLVELVGGFAKTPSGFKRYENYVVLKKYEDVRLFWHVSNKHDKNAIAVFPSCLTLNEDRILGYVDKERNKDIICAFKEGLLIFSYISYINCWKKINKHDEIIEEYSANMVIKGFPKEDAPLSELLFSHCYMSWKVIKNFIDAGFNSPDIIRAASDKDLKKVYGVGPKIIERIHKYFSSSS